MVEPPACVCILKMWIKERRNKQNRERKEGIFFFFLTCPHEREERRFDLVTSAS
jgi:hypothetical protein